MLLLTIKSPLLIDIPTTFETERLRITAAQTEDAPAMLDAALASRSQIDLWLPSASFGDYTAGGIQLLLRRRMAQWITREYLMFHIFRRSDAVFIGSCGLHHIDWEIPAFQVGYWVDSRHSGQGYITEAIKGLTRFAFEQLAAERVDLHCDPLNTASVGVAKRAGFQQEAHLRCYERDHHGKLTDTLIFSIIRRDHFQG